MVDDCCSVVGLQVLDNLISRIQISSVNDVHALSAIHRIAKRDRISAFCCFDAKKIDLEVVSHTSLLFYANKVLVALPLPAIHRTCGSCRSPYQRHGGKTTSILGDVAQCVSVYARVWAAFRVAVPSSDEGEIP